jgi:tRNA(Arg) A34 adenosine deaminase TadA
VTPTEAELDALERVIALARERHVPGGGPVFTAAVVRDGKLLSLSENESKKDHDPSRHAEIVAIAEAARAAGDTMLPGATLIASMQPCEMCLAAMRWARIDRLVFAMTQEAAPKFFRFPGLGIADFARAGETFVWVGGIGLDRVADIYKDGA